MDWFPSAARRRGVHIANVVPSKAKAKDRVRRWRRQALPVALVVRCWRRSSIPGSQNTWSMNILCRLFKNKAPCLAFNISEPVHWKWKKKKVGLSSIVKTSLPLHLLVQFRSVNLVSWLGLNRDLPKLDKFSQILILMEPLVVQFQSVNLVSWLGLDRDLPKLNKFS